MTVTYYEIPLSPNAQRFYVTLAGVQYQVQVAWRTAAEGGWFLDLYDGSGNALVLGVPLVTGVDLLAPYPDLGIGGSLYVTTDGAPDAVPLYANLGTTAHLYFAVTS